jgi:hypothetical protein
MAKARTLGCLLQTLLPDLEVDCEEREQHHLHRLGFRAQETAGRRRPG